MGAGGNWKVLGLGSLCPQVITRSDLVHILQFSKPAFKKQRKCHDFGAVRKLLSRSAGYFSFCGTEKSGQTQ